MKEKKNDVEVNASALLKELDLIGMEMNAITLENMKLLRATETLLRSAGSLKYVIDNKKAAGAISTENHEFAAAVYEVVRAYDTALNILTDAPTPNLSLQN